MVPIFYCRIKTLNLYILKPTDEFYYKILKEERFCQNSLDVINNQDDVKTKAQFQLDRLTAVT